MITHVRYLLVEGKAYPDMKAVFKHYGIKAKTYYARRDAGMGQVEALLKPVRVSSK